MIRRLPRRPDLMNYPVLTTGLVTAPRGIGSMEDIIIGKDNVLLAVLQVGGFLHIGGHMVAVPSQSLVLDETGNKIKFPGATQEALKNLPEFKYTG
jgi:hypothetical protein